MILGSGFMLAEIAGDDDVLRVVDRRRMPVLYTFESALFGVII